MKISSSLFSDGPLNLGMRMVRLVKVGVNRHISRGVGGNGHEDERKAR